MTPEDESKIRKIINEELSKKKSQSNGDKSKRDPSKWQIHLKGCIPTKDKKLSMGEKVKACSVDYKKNRDEDIESQLKSIANIK